MRMKFQLLSGSGLTLQWGLKILQFCFSGTESVQQYLAWGDYHESQFKEDVMLVLSRKPGESLVIGDSIFIRVSEIRGNRVKLCIDAPSDVRVLRSEVAAQLDSQDVATDFVEFLSPPVAMVK